jgi:alpha,alpha-trehalase
MDSWKLAYHEFDPGKEKLREALCTLGNGAFATRGAAPEARPDDVHYPGTYAAGLYNRLKSDVHGRAIENEDLVNLPNWLPLEFRIDRDDWLDLRRAEILEFLQELDLRRGVLQRRVRLRDEKGRITSLSERRFVHMREPQLAGLEITVTAENWSGELTARAALDGTVENRGVERYRQLASKHLEPIASGSLDWGGTWLKVRTRQSRIEIAEAARVRLFRAGKPTRASRNLIEEPDYVAEELSLPVRSGESVTVEKIVALVTSRDPVISECGLQAQEAAQRAGRFEDLLHSHQDAWAQLWRRCEIQLTGCEPRAAMILRLHIFHLLQTVSPNSVDRDIGVPARGWHGEAYRGHVFWDELFIFPFLNLRLPEITRSLLRYRYRRLGEARRAAAEAGCRGTMYPWQSGSTGREESQALHLNPRSKRWIPDNSHRQRHLNAAIAYNIWQYYQATADHEFMHVYGAEMLLEIARFWASAARHDPDSNRFEIPGVMGPDEYHDNYPDRQEGALDNNAYTNVMAAWTLWHALKVLQILPKERSLELERQLGIDERELARWDEISRKLKIPFHGDGIISQFEGYEQLEELDWEAYRQKYESIERLDRVLEAENDTANRYNVSKQADVLMLFYLFSAEELGGLFERLGYELQPDTIPKNIRYYMQRTSHGSTLSRVVHSWVLARSDRERSWQLFSEALESDVADVQGGTTPEGIHLGAMAGTVDLVQRSYTGIETRDGTIWFNPCLPDDISCIELRLRYHGRWLDVIVEREQLRLRADADAIGPIRFGFKDRIDELQPGECREIKL